MKKRSVDWGMRPKRRDSEAHAKKMARLRKLVTDGKVCSRVNINIPNEIHREFKSICTEMNKTMSQILMDSIIEIIKKYKDQKLNNEDI